MKQGQASSSKVASTKVEPNPRAVSPAAVSQIGVKQGNHASDGGHTVNVKIPPLYEGRGLQAPMVGAKSHKSGSQGSY